MELVHKLENTVAGWYKGAPHLPPNGQVWLWKNVWWIVLIGVILSAVSLLFVLGSLVFLMSFVGVVDSAYGSSTAAAYGSLSLIAVLVSIVVLVVTLILEAIAIKPLKDLQKKGWNLIFLALLANIIGSVVALIVSINAFNLILTLIWSAIGAYFLFEIRHLYGAKADKEAKVEPSA